MRRKAWVLFVPQCLSRQLQKRLLGPMGNIEQPHCVQIVKENCAWLSTFQHCLRPEGGRSSPSPNPNEKWKLQVDLLVKGVNKGVGNVESQGWRVALTSRHHRHLQCLGVLRSSSKWKRNTDHVLTDASCPLVHSHP